MNMEHKVKEARRKAKAEAKREKRQARRREKAGPPSNRPRAWIAPSASQRIEQLVLCETISVLTGSGVS
jgi:hypothetical protein